MGILSGTISYKGYYVENYNPSAVDIDDLVDRLKRGRFRQINRAMNQKESMGFTDPKDPFQEDFNLANVVMDRYLFFNFRRDVIKLQKRVINQFLKELQEHHKGEPISTAKMKELKQKAEDNYAQKVFPVVHNYEVVWDIDDCILYFFNTSKGVNDKFTDWFEKYFQVGLVEIETATIAERYLDKNHYDAFETRMPSSLVTI